MSGNATNWVAAKLVENGLKIVARSPENFLVVRSDGYEFMVAVLGVQGVIQLSDVEPLFAGATKPQLVVNVPSKTLWSGAAIHCVHTGSAAFGTLQDVSRAATTGDAGSYRDKNMGFFINAIQQHTNVSGVSYVFDRVIKAHRRAGASLVIAVIDAYNMSAEDVRNARARFGHFDIVVKSSSYGSITSEADAAAKTMGAQALTFSELMGRLAR